LGKKQYELTNHLGNVLATVSDIKFQQDYNADNEVDRYTADIITAQDYYPGGFLIAGRAFNSNSYRFGYNAGSEKDDEITETTGSHFTTFFREFDTRLLIPWSPDPVFQPWQSPYSYIDGNPILINDPLGDQGNPIKDFFRGVGNVLSGRPWGAKHALNLVKGPKPQKEWAFMRQPGQGIVKEIYLNQLQSKVDRYRTGETDLAWSDRLMGRIQQSITHELEVKDPSNVTQPSTVTETLHVPKLPKVYQAEFRPTLLSGGMQTNVLLGDKPVYSATGFSVDPSRPLFKVINSDNITISLSRVQPTFGNTYGTSGVSISGQLREYRVIPSFTYKVRLQIKD
jgi:hypothetical protein